MILLLDVGNTRLKWGLREGGQWLAQGAFAHDEAWTFDAVLPPPGRIDGVCGASVVSPELRQRVADALAAWGHAPQWLTPTRSCCGVRNSYVNPAQLGADRWAALIGAHAHGAAPCLVVTAGTATTIDVLDAEGVFRGGLIAPGVDLMRRALAGNTAQLPLADGGIVDLPTCTADAIMMGCLHAQAGAIERMYRQVAGLPGASCLLNGGAAAQIAPLLDVPLRLIDNLVLDGVAVVQAQGCFR
ncbi:type III pantothenate kinase [Denitromonas sp.]|uniref:type III pantothenate kinase n=1 Tax=Denitromonas sp. TaxID=2734609 RepID=UPI003A870E8A